MSDLGQPSRGARSCPSCGRSMALAAAFCRNCGARYEETAAAPPPAPEPVAVAPPMATPPTPSPPAQGRRPRTGIVFLVASIVLAAAGVAAAIVLGGGSDSSPTVVLTTVGEQSTDEGTSGSDAAATAPVATGAIEAGRYIQAGSFKFVADAEAERERLAAEGVDVQVMSSEEAQELYPGFQVLIAGPLQSGSEEAFLLKQLHRHGVPSAFARELTPAASVPGYSAVEGMWTGWLEESSASRPQLDRKLHLRLAMYSGGRGGVMVFLNVECIFHLIAAGAGTGASLEFDQESGCIAPGVWHLRPSQGRLALTLLPPDRDLIVLGTLRRES